MKINKLEVDGNPYRRPVNIVKVKQMPVENGKEEQKILLGVLSGISGVGVSKYAWKGFQMTNTLTHEQVITNLVSNGLAANHAPSAADTVLKIIRSEPTKVFLVAVASGGGTWAVLEAGSRLFGRKMSKKVKLIVSFSIGLLVAILYAFLRRAGYFS